MIKTNRSYSNAKRNARRGFTLIELMIVIAIIGVLAAIAVPNFKAARERANMRACMANQKTITGALEMYNLDKNKSEKKIDAGVLGNLKTDGYLQSIPIDPGSGKQPGEGYKWDDKEGSVICDIHGSIAAPKGPGAPTGGTGPATGTN